MVFYKAVFEKDENGYGISFPALEGCFSMGETYEDAYYNAQEALGLYITSLEANGDDIPQDVSEDEIELAKGEVITLVSCNLNLYRPQKAVKKTLTIPQYLNEAGLREKINFSQILQDALIKKLGL